MVSFLLGQQHGYTKYPYFLCMWDSKAREKHWIEANWPNIIYEPLFDRKKIIFPPLHLKLDLMNQFVKALSTEDDCLKYIILAFSELSIEKSRLVCLMVHKFYRSSKMSDLEKNTWLSFKDVVKSFYGNTQASNYT